MSGSETPRVLVVDDEPAVRELLADALSSFQLSIEIDLAANGAEAIAAAGRRRPDIVVTDMYLGDCTGLDMIDRLRKQAQDFSAVVITGHQDPCTFTKASRCRPIEMMSKPLDLERLRETIRTELDRRRLGHRQQRRSRRLRDLARKFNQQRKAAQQKLHTTCHDLSSAYGTISNQMALQQLVLSYQQEMIAAKSDDDVFRSLFRLMVHRSGPIFGVAMVCDGDAELQMIGRFGVPYPDDSTFCGALIRPVVGQVMANPRCLTLDAGDERELFDASVRRYLPGVTVLAVPLVPEAGQLIGLLVLYRKGEQPFTPDDVGLTELLALPTALAVQRND